MWRACPLGGYLSAKSAALASEARLNSKTPAEMRGEAVEGSRLGGQVSNQRPTLRSERFQAVITSAFFGQKASMKQMLDDVASHAVQPIQHFAVVIVLVPKIEDGENYQRGYEEFACRIQMDVPLQIRRFQV
jgi:hypothetical protein